MIFRILTAFLSLAFTCSPALAAAIDESKFHKVVLDDTCKEPMEISIAKNGQVFFIERTGNLKVWSPKTSQTLLAGKIPVHFNYAGDKENGSWEDGLIGLCLDPDFENNQWLYLFYSATTAPENRLSRFTFKDGTLDLPSEKILLRVPTDRDVCCHAAGSITFDAQKNLYVSTGDNTNPFESDNFSPIDFRPARKGFDAARSSGNKNDLRGKILRIKPKPDGTYAIPDGNLFHPDGLKAKAEIFVMGCRNPFRISVDTKTSTLYWGDVGPDAREPVESRGPAGFDEINRTQQPGNFGWPFFIADNKPYLAYDFETKKSGEPFDPANPVNKSPNVSASPSLPPAQPAWIYYPYGPSTRFPEVGSGGRTTGAGPIYYYDSGGGTETKLPESYHNSFFFFDWERNWIRRVELQSAKDKTLPKVLPFVTHLIFKRPIDMELGPDGCLYVVEWGTAWGINNDSKIVRLEYRK